MCLPKLAQIKTCHRFSSEGLIKRKTGSKSMSYDSSLYCLKEIKWTPQRYGCHNQAKKSQLLFQQNSTATKKITAPLKKCPPLLSTSTTFIHEKSRNSMLKILSANNFMCITLGQFCTLKKHLLLKPNSNAQLTLFRLAARPLTHQLDVTLLSLPLEISRRIT